MPRQESKTLRWFVVQTQVGRERLALLHLGRQGFDSFCPMRLKPRRVGRHQQNASSPFFPGYLFVRVDLERQRWRSINGTIGVVRIVSFGAGGRPAPLPRGFAETLRAMTSVEGTMALDERFTPGDRVRVIGGPFDELCGTLERAADGERVTILLDLLSKQTRVQLSREMLIAA